MLSKVNLFGSLARPSLCGKAGLSYAGGNIPATTQNIINGQWVESKTDRWIDVHNPATNQVVTKVPHTTRDEMEAAVESAKNAFKTWSKTTPLARQQIMFRLENRSTDSSYLMT